MKNIYPLLFFLFLFGGLIAHNGFGQHNFGIKYFGLTIHPKGEKQPELMPYKLDRKAVYVVNFGTILSYQQYIYRDILSIKLAQGVYSDSGGLLAGHTHIGPRIQFFKGKNFEVLFGFGPTLIYRRNWNIKPGYEPSGLFKEKGNVQYKYVWYGGEFEFNQRLNEKFDLSVHILPGYPRIVSFGFGIRYWPTQTMFE